MIKINKLNLCYGFMAMIGFLLRWRTLSVFEFKYDQWHAIILGQEALANHFRITHGALSSTGISYPPGFIWLMGLIAIFTKNPQIIAHLFLIISSLTLFLALYLFKKSLPSLWGIASAFYVSVCPMFYHYAGNIGEPALTPALTVLFLFFFYKFINTRNIIYYVFLFMTTLAAFQLHFMGWILVPAFIWISVILRKNLTPKTILSCIFLWMLTSWPYFRYLVYEGGASSFQQYLAAAYQKSGLVKIFFKSQSLAVSNDFFSYYLLLGKFRHLYREYFHPLGLILLSLNPIPFFLLLGGYIGGLYFLIKDKAFFTWDQTSVTMPYPPIFYLSAGISLSAFMMPIMGIDTHVYYHLVFIPCYAILIGYAIKCCWSIFAGKIIVLATWIALIMPFFPIYNYLEKSGGFFWEYGIHYGQLLKWKKVIREHRPPRQCVKTKAAYLGPNFQKGVFSPQAIEYALHFDDECESGFKQTLNLFIRWNSNEERFEEKIIA